MPTKFSMQKKCKDMTDEMTARKAVLTSILEQNGMQFRDDSKLAFDYIHNDGDVFLVAHEILCTNFLFQNTDYDDLCQIELKKMANAMKAQYGLSWTRTWSIVREFGVPALKMRALLDKSLVMPIFNLQIPLDTMPKI